jgi:tRNA-dihydrouridine synthase A
MKPGYHFSVAPMMECTDQHYRYFARLISPNAWLYTEMITTGALLNNDPHRFLAFDESEHPVALQLGGNDPKHLALCAKLGADFGYDEINLNVGCPSSRVKQGCFGASLMLHPKLVAECIKSMVDVVNIPVTVKCRIGVDDHDSYEALCYFIDLVAQSGCQTFIVHARKAWLNGLSPKQNRDVPPLQYETVFRLKQDFPSLRFIINGGVNELDIFKALYHKVDGVMIGREAYSNPYFLAQIENFLSPNQKILSRHEVVQHFIPYLETQLKQGTKLSTIVRHILGLFQSEVGARKWRRYLSENSHLETATIDVVHQALTLTKP